MKCMYCGAPMNDDERLCSYCGEKQKIDEKIWKETSCNVVVNVYHHEPEGRERVVYVDHPVRRVSDRNRLVSLLLCFFLGLIGVHKFYERKIGLGLLYLISCGLGGVGIVFDLLRLAFGHPHDGEGLPIEW